MGWSKQNSSKISRGKEGSEGAGLLAAINAMWDQGRGAVAQEIVVDTRVREKGGMGGEGGEMPQKQWNHRK